MNIMQLKYVYPISRIAPGWRKARRSMRGRARFGA